MNFKLVLGVVVGLTAAQLFSGPGVAQEKPAKKLELKSVKDRAAYAIGANSAGSIRRVNEGQSLGLDTELIMRGFRDGLGSGKLAIPDEELEDALQKLQDEVGARNAKAGEAFLAANKGKPGVKSLESGMQVKVLKKGTGKKPTINDTVVVHYRGKRLDGKEFESSYTANEPATMPVARALPGWSEALQMMEVGSKWELYLPPDLAFGPQSGEKFGPNSTLIFELELVDIAKGNPALGPGGDALPPKGKPAGKPEELDN